MKLKPNFQQLGAYANGSIAHRRLWALLIAFVGGFSVTDAEPIVPLVTPLIVPLQENETNKKAEPGIELGFPRVTPDENAAPSTGDFLGTVPGNPNSPFFPDEFIDPSFPNDTDILDGSLPEDLPLEPELAADDPESDLSLVSDDFADPLWQSVGGVLRGGIGGGWQDSFVHTPGFIPMGGRSLGFLHEGINLSATLSGSYITNPSQGIGARSNSGQGDYSMSLGGSVGYRSPPSNFTYGFTYSGSYNQYFSQTDLNRYNQSAAASLNYVYEGGPLTAVLSVGIGFGSGANRNYASFVDEITYNYNLNARYSVSEKTTLAGNFSQGFSNASGGSDISSFNLGLSALWRYSPLTEFGPGVSYTRSGGIGSGQDRTSIGPTLTVNHKLAEKLSLNAQVGANFADYGDGDSADASFSTSVRLNYSASSQWGMDLSLGRDVRPSFTGANEFEEITALRLGYNRRIRRASWTIGLGWEYITSDNPAGTAATRPDRSYLSLDTALSMPVFADTTSASIFMSYSNQDGTQSGVGNESWDSFQIGFSLSRSF